jgi:hypothetical protein
MVQPSPFCPVVSIQLPEQSKVPVLSMTGILQPVPKNESQPELEEFLCCRSVLMYGPIYKQLIEAQFRRKIALFGLWPSEFSLQARTDILEISNVSFSEWEEIKKRDKKIREIHRLTTQEQLPIQFLSYLYSIATQIPHQCKRFVAEVQLVADKVFNYVSLLVLGPVLAVLCCAVNCKDDRSSLCWMLKLVSTCHPILGICVDVCDKIVEFPTSTTSTEPPQRKVRFNEKIMERLIPPPETRQEKLARLIATCDELCARR